MNNKAIYDKGYSLGLEFGVIKALGKVIDLNAKGLIHTDQLCMQALDAIQTVTDNINYLDILNVDVAKKELQMFLLGYADGKSSNVQNKANKKYQDKIGLMSKSYKLDKKLVQDFAESCDSIGTTQAKQLTLMMQDFIDNHKE